MNTIEVPYRFGIKTICRRSTCERKIRLLKVVWSNGLNGMKPGWKTYGLSVNLVPHLWRFERAMRGIVDHKLTIAGVQLHFQTCQGGWIV
jgi:hypothetical protein